MRLMIIQRQKCAVQICLLKGFVITNFNPVSFFPGLQY